MASPYYKPYAVCRVKYVYGHIDFISQHKNNNDADNNDVREVMTERNIYIDREREKERG